MSIISAPSEFLYFNQIKEHKEIKAKIIDKINDLLQTEEVKENKPFKDCLFKTSFKKDKINEFLLQLNTFHLIMYYNYGQQAKEA